MDATKLIEEAGREIAHMKAEALSAANPYNENTIRLTLLIDLAAALKASEERARKADELASANLAANKRIVELEHERDAAKRQISALENQLVNAAALRIEDEAHCERLIAERDAARAELARLTTPRPITEATKDGTWVLLPFSTTHWDAVGPGPRFIVARWFAAAWVDALGRVLGEPSHFLPLPVLP